MCRIRLWCILAIFAVRGGLCFGADAPASAPRNSDSAGTTAAGPTVPVASPSPTIPPPVRGRLFRPSRPPSQTPVGPSPSRTVAASARNPGERRIQVDPPRAASGSSPSARVAGVVRRDPPVRRIQATASDMSVPIAPSANPLPSPPDNLSALATPSPAGGQSISLQAALYGAITSNPDLVTLRQGNAIAASAEAVEVARHFPTTLNPTVWIDYRPINLVPNGTFGTGPQGHGPQPGLLSLWSKLSFISRCDSPSSSGTRPPIATTLPRPRLINKSGSLSRPS